MRFFADEPVQADAQANAHGGSADAGADAGAGAGPCAGSPRPRGRAALEALTAAALLLPGLACADLAAPSDEGVSLQFGHYREGRRSLGDVPASLPPLRAESLLFKAVLALPRGDGLTLSYAQDTWSGATPIATAPASAHGNRAIQTGAAGQLITVGASPMINGTVLLDAMGRPVTLDAAGRAQAAPALLHTLAGASPETRRQVDGKFSHRLGDAVWTLGGGLSDERDYRSRFLNLGARLDLNERGSTLSAGLSHTRSRTAAALDHDAAPYITKTAYAQQIENIRGLQVLRGQREDWSASAGWTQVLSQTALLETHLLHTRSTGYLANPYKLTSVIFAPPTADPSALSTGSLQALLEQRPNQRRQWTAGGKLVLHQAATDAALHLGYGYSRDNWGIAAHRLEAEWFQPLPGGWMAAPRLSYYTQSAARFYTPYLVSRQAYRTVTIDDRGQPVITAFRPELLPAAFSSDPRLSAFGSLGVGAGLSKRLERGISLELGVETARHAGSLKAGGGGEGAYADFRYWVANAALKLDFDASPSGSAAPGSEPSAEAASGGAGAHMHQHQHQHQPMFHAPPGVQLAHVADAPGELMIGAGAMLMRQAGDLRHGRATVDEAELASQACLPAACASRPLRMRMQMQMLDLMLGLTDRLSLMLMPQYVTMQMDEVLVTGAPPSDTHVHFGRHETGGLGDTQLHALFKLQDDAQQRWIVGLGLSAPTGSTSQSHRRSHQQDAGFMSYDMQLGSGTWDWLPSISYLAQRGPWSGGAQWRATLRPSSGGRQGYALGDAWQASAWLARGLGGGWSASMRASYSVEQAIKGQRSGPHPDASPADSPANHGGRFSELGLGLSVDDLPGFGARSMLGIEAVLPLRSQPRGYQLERGSSLVLSWRQHF